MSHGPMRGKRYGGGCGCCGGNQPPERAAEKRAWNADVAADVAAAISEGRMAQGGIVRPRLARSRWPKPQGTATVSLVDEDA